MVPAPRVALGFPALQTGTLTAVLNRHKTMHVGGVEPPLVGYQPTLLPLKYTCEMVGVRGIAPLSRGPRPRTLLLSYTPKWRAT